MKRNNNWVNKGSWLSKFTVSLLLAGGLAACNQRTEQPDVVVVSPAPQPTVTVAVTPTPQSTSSVDPSPGPGEAQTTTTTTVTTNPTPQATTQVVTTQPITEVVIINTTPDKQTLVNRPVQFTNVKVQSVVGDRTFWVGQSNTQRLFVVLAPNLDAGSAEKNVVVKAGQSLDLAGALKPAPSEAQAQKQWKGLNAAEAKGLNNQVVYLEANQIKFK